MQRNIRTPKHDPVTYVPPWNKCRPDILYVMSI